MPRRWWERHARVHFAINPDAAKLKRVNTDFLHRLFHSCGGISVSLLKQQEVGSANPENQKSHLRRKEPEMQTQLSTANPDLASLPITGYLMETPPPPDPIDPPDNQGGGG